RQVDGRGDQIGVALRPRAVRAIQRVLESYPDIVALPERRLEHRPGRLFDAVEQSREHDAVPVEDGIDGRGGGQGAVGEGFGRFDEDAETPPRQPALDEGFRIGPAPPARLDADPPPSESLPALPG